MVHRGKLLKEPITAEIVVGKDEAQQWRTVPKYWTWICDTCGTEYVGRGEARHCEWMHEHKDDLKHQIARDQAERGWIMTNAVEIHRSSFLKPRPKAFHYSLDIYSLYEYDTAEEIAGPFVIKEEAQDWIVEHGMKEIQ